MDRFREVGIRTCVAPIIIGKRKERVYEITDGAEMAVIFRYITTSGDIHIYVTGSFRGTGKNDFSTGQEPMAVCYD